MNVTFIEDESYFVNLHLKREINESENILLVYYTPLLNPELELVGANQGERKAMKIQQKSRNVKVMRNQKERNKQFMKIMRKSNRDQRRSFSKFTFARKKKKKKSMNLLFQAKNHFQIQPCNILLTIGFPTHPLKILFFILMIFYDSKKKSSKLYQTSFI